MAENIFKSRRCETLYEMAGNYLNCQRRVWKIPELGKKLMPTEIHCKLTAEEHCWRI